MSILIKDIDMPKRCCECFANYHGVCNLYSICLSDTELYKLRAYECPLIPVDCTKEQLTNEIEKLRSQRSSLIDLARDLYADLTEDIKVLNEDLEDAKQELKIYLDRWEIEPYD